ncbi:MAG: hypothetical protein ACI84K_001175 [Pseudohongiellaceae bacterium]|jgi:hypothetical protein
MNALLKNAKDFLENIHPMPQNALTIHMPVIKSKELALRQILAKINQNPADNAVFPFSVFDHLHFARFLLLDGPDHPKTYAASLIFMANVDGTSADFIDELLKQVSNGLDQILCACIAYPSKSKRSRSSRKEFLCSHTLGCQTFYINTVGRSAIMIRQEDELRDALQLFLNDLDPDSFKSSKALRNAVIKFVRNNAEISWALASRPQPSLLWRSLESIRFAAITALGILIVAWAWPILVAWVMTLRLRECKDPEDTHRPELARLTLLRSSEDITAQNPFAAVGHLKTGLLRRATARGLLIAAQAALRHVFNRGDLAGIPLLGLAGVDTIHFARWTMLDNDQRLLFTSNYDGSLESYMVDFIDKVAWGLNLIFSNGKGYPQTRWIVHDGARKEQRFKDYLGNHQIENQVWFTAYSKLTAVNIANNEAIHDGLQGRMNERQASAWLKRL